jgi:cytochrome c peroxidase
MFWDSRASSPLDLSLQPVFNHIEMGIETDEMLVEKVSAASYYPELFTNAFGSEEITKERISLAITAFVNSIFSMESKFDQGVVNEFANFTSLEKIGKDLFHSDRLMCTSCHAGDNFSAPDFPGGPYGSSGFRGDDDSGPKGTANIGLDLVHKDAGRADGKFKIPSLRNVALTAPYMHDGRFNTLDEVLDHYSHGIQNHPNLDSKFIENGQTVKLNITEAEKIALIAFLNTFTDENLITDPKFSNPFH